MENLIVFWLAVVSITTAVGQNSLSNDSSMPPSLQPGSYNTQLYLNLYKNWTESFYV